MMNDTFGISHSALSGLGGYSFALPTGLHPVLADSALSGLGGYSFALPTGLHPVLADSALSGLTQILIAVYVR
jgi:hypothetical protein